MARISGDVMQRALAEGRHRATRYELRLKMRYAILRHGVKPVTGAGESVNVSVTGLLFRGEARVYAGDSVVAALDWPVAAPNNEALYLIVTGCVVRARRAMIAIAIASKRLLRASEIDERFDLFWGAGNTEAGTGRRIAVVDADAATVALASNVLRPPRWTLKRVEAEAAKWMVSSGMPEIGVVITCHADLLDCVPPTMPVILTVEEGAPERLPDEARFSRLTIVPRSLLATMLPDIVQRICTTPDTAKADTPTSAA